LRWIEEKEAEEFYPCRRAEEDGEGVVHRKKVLRL
jgi:hypothetical protein